MADVDRESLEAIQVRLGTLVEVRLTGFTPTEELEYSELVAREAAILDERRRAAGRFLSV